MAEMRKITVFVPTELLDGCQKITGTGVSETLRAALRDMRHEWARRRLLELQGTIDLEADGITLKMLRDMDDDNGQDDRAA